MKRLLIRVLRNDESYENGIIAKKPEGKVTLTYFIRKGSSIKSQFIATTKDIGVAIESARLSGNNRMVFIDLDQLIDETDVEIYDVSGDRAIDVMKSYPGEGEGKDLRYYEIAKNFANASKEVDLIGKIPRDCYTVVEMAEIEAFLCGGPHGEGVMEHFAGK